MTVLFSLSWMGENGEHVSRYQQWLEYYLRLKDRIGWNEILIVDDGSPRAFLSPWRKQCESYGQILCFPHLGRKGDHIYPYAWRAFQVAKSVVVHANRLLWIESDFAAISDRFIEWLRTADGFEAPWCEVHGIPETGCMIMAESGRSVVYNYQTPDPNKDCRFETAVPLTTVRKSFVGNRLEGTMRVPDNADFMAQCSEGIEKALCTNR